MKQVGAAQFKEQCLRILDTLTPEGIIVTKHGKAIARVIPIKEECASLIGALKTKLKVKKNVSIFTTGEAWDAEP